MYSDSQTFERDKLIQRDSCFTHKLACLHVKGIYISVTIENSDGHFPQKSLTSHRGLLQWINFALASDSKCLVVPWWPKIDLIGWLMAQAALIQQSSYYIKNPTGPTNICLTVYLNQKVNVVIFKQQWQQVTDISRACNTSEPQRNQLGSMKAMQHKLCFNFTPISWSVTHIENICFISYRNTNITNKTVKDCI